MPAKSKQHESWWAGIRIVHPELNEGQPYYMDIPALQREYDSEGRVKTHLKKLPKAQQDQQVIHYSVIQLFAKLHTNYFMEGWDGLHDMVIPAIQRNFNLKTLTPDQLAFRKFKVNENMKIYHTNGKLVNVDGEEGFDHVWVEYAVFKELKELRDRTPELLESRLTGKVTTDKPAKEEEVVTAYDFMNTNSVLESVSKASKQASKASKQNK